MEKITRRDFLKVMGAISGTTFVAPAFPISEQPADTSGHTEFLEGIAKSHDWEVSENLKQDFWMEIDGKRVDGILDVDMTLDSGAVWMGYDCDPPYIPGLMETQIRGVFVYDPELPLAAMVSREHELAFVCNGQRVRGKAIMTSHFMQFVDDDPVIVCEWFGKGLFGSSANLGKR
jgi:hypothetical protein